MKFSSTANLPLSKVDWKLVKNFLFWVSDFTLHVLCRAWIKEKLRMVKSYNCIGGEIDEKLNQQLLYIESQ